MSPEVAITLGYAAGSLLTLGTATVAQVRAETLGRRARFPLTDSIGFPGPALAYVTLWPIMITVFAATFIGEGLGLRAKRRLLAAEERRRWLDTPVERLAGTGEKGE